MVLQFLVPVVVGYTCSNLNPDLVLAQGEMDGICLLARKEVMGTDDFEEGREREGRNGLPTTFKSSNKSEGLGMQVCVCKGTIMASLNMTANES